MLLPFQVQQAKKQNGGADRRLLDNLDFSHNVVHRAFQRDAQVLGHVSHIALSRVATLDVIQRGENVVGHAYESPIDSCSSA